MKILFRSGIAITAVLSLGSCGLFEDVVNGFADMETRSFTLAPTIEGVHYTRHQYNTGACVPVFLNRRGTGASMRFFWEDRGGIDAVGLLVGYYSALARGDDPFPCNLWVFSSFQGKALFDVTDLPAGSIVTQANLTMTRDRNPTVDIGDETSPCRYYLGTATGLSTAVFQTVSGPEGEIATRAARPDSSVTSSRPDVTRTVAQWVRSGARDTWFVISPDPDETFEEHGEDDDVAQCHMHVDNLMLEITARVPAGS